MDKVVVFKNTDGSCGVIHPSPKCGLTIEEVATKDVPKGLEYRIIDKSLLPQDRYFRNAWTDDNPTDTVDIDMEKARSIHMDKIRKARDKKFKEMGFPVKLDTDLEAAVIPKQTRDKLQALRDIPQTLDLSVAQTPEELKAIMPEELL